MDNNQLSKGPIKMAPAVAPMDPVSPIKTVPGLNGGIDAQNVTPFFNPSVSKSVPMTKMAPVKMPLTPPTATIAPTPSISPTPSPTGDRTQSWMAYMIKQNPQLQSWLTNMQQTSPQTLSLFMQHWMQSHPGVNF